MGLFGKAKDGFKVSPSGDLLPDEGFQNVKGEFNIQSFQYMQAFTRPEGSSDVMFDEKVDPFVEPSERKGLLSKVFGKDDQNQRAVWNRIHRALREIVRPCRMGGYEYEGGRMEANMADHVRSHTYVADQREITVHLNFQKSEDQKWSINWNNENTLEEGQEPRDPNLSTWDEKLKEGLALPGTVTTTVYAIAPKGKTNATLEMAQAHAAQRQTGEIGTHRGCALQTTMLNRAIEEAKEGYVPSQYADRDEDIAWFDIYEGVFFTLDEQVFNRMKVAFDVKEDLSQKVVPAKPAQKVAPSAA